jgi:hypothetical protein
MPHPASGPTLLRTRAYPVWYLPLQARKLASDRRTANELRRVLNRFRKPRGKSGDAVICQKGGHQRFGFTTP